NYLLQRCRTRVCKLAGVLLGIFSHDRQVRYLDVQLIEAGGDADGSREPADGADRLFRCFQRRKIPDVFTHGNGDVGVALRAGNDVELADGGEQDGIADAVGEVVET